MPIHFLSPEDAQKVAAGEVIERPANIIKELIENSIDAGATRIELSVIDGGKTLIQITDNGSGMTEKDAHLCFERHATSKIFRFDDLITVNTFGFRGEALASVCGVAKVTLTTKMQHSLEGISLQIEEGKVLKSTIVSAVVGTTIVVKDLFYNIPVRKKFLKTTATEWNQIIALFKAFCVSYRSIHFLLLHNEIQVYNCPPVELLSQRIHQLFDQSINSHQLELSSTTQKDMVIEGIISNPHYSRYDRSGLFFFVNNRLVKNYQLARAVMKGYAGVLPSDKYPFAIIQLTIDPHQIDINIHPKKEEVLFLHPHLVQDAVTKAVKNTLEINVLHATQKPVQNFVTATQSSTSFFQKDECFFPDMQLFKSTERISLAPTKTPFIETTEADSSNYKTQLEHETFSNQNEVFTEPFNTEKTVFHDVVKKEPYQIIGQLHTTYILLEHPSGMLLIDQHAAHERILYERFKTKFGTIETVGLLFPPVVHLLNNDVLRLFEHEHLFKNVGIYIEQYGQDHIRITSVPVYAKHLQLQEFIEQVVNWIKESESLPVEQLFKTITEKMRAQLACKAAVKAGDSLSHQEMIQLLQDLELTESRFSCPHGRPTQWLLNTYEIEKKFKRIV